MVKLRIYAWYKTIRKHTPLAGTATLLNCLRSCIKDKHCRWSSTNVTYCTIYSLLNQLSYSIGAHVPNTIVLTYISSCGVVTMNRTWSNLYRISKNKDGALQCTYACWDDDGIAWSEHGTGKGSDRWQLVSYTYTRPQQWRLTTKM